MGINIVNTFIVGALALCVWWWAVWNGPSSARGAAGFMTLVYAIYLIQYLRITGWIPF